MNLPQMYEYLFKTKLSDPDDMQWFCQEKDATCWDKLHKYYIPNGLFPTLSQIELMKLSASDQFCHVIKKSKLYKERDFSIKLYRDRGFIFDAGKTKAPVNVATAAKAGKR